MSDTEEMTPSQAPFSSFSPSPFSSSLHLSVFSQFALALSKKKEEEKKGGGTFAA